MSHVNHFYVVFNPLLNGEHPLYATQAHEFYAQLKQRVAQPEKKYLYWGKMAVNDKEDNIQTYKQIIETNKRAGEETHLYITDYHHFWVAKVDGVFSSVPSKEDTLSFYDNKDVNLWFKISDMDLISAEFNETGFYLSQLSIDNDFEELKLPQLTPYIGGLKFPVIVQDNTHERFFRFQEGDFGLRVQRENGLIRNPQLVDEIKYQVNSFVLPPHVYSSLSHAVKNEIINIETKISKNKELNNDLLYSIYSSYSDILETSVYDFIIPVFKEEFGESLYISNNGRNITDHFQEDFTLLANFHRVIHLETFFSFFENSHQFGNLSLKNFDHKYPGLSSFFVNELAPFFSGYTAAKNESENFSLSQKKVFEFRNFILGVGSKGVINNIYGLIKENPTLNLVKKVA